MIRFKTMGIQPAKWVSAAMMSLTMVGLSALPGWSQVDRLLKIGIEQRFGDQVGETLTLTALPGDRLTLRYATTEGEATLETDSVKLQIEMKPLPQPMVEERVVLSTHRSFESAEHDAQKWQERGLEVEIANPERWQVWAKREVYNTPLLRRLLLDSLKSEGNTIAHIETKVLRTYPQAYWIVNGYRYNRRSLEVESGNNRIQVVHTGGTTRLYGGSLRMQPNAYGNYTLVNFVPLETYLRGVVPHEIGPQAPPAAVEAQAILARTYTLRNLRRFAIDDYELCATTDCQVYWGLGDASARADRAISVTRSLVATYENELVDALYSSTTGGVTAPFEDVWDGQARPYLRAVVDSTGSIWDLSQKSLGNEANLRQFLNLKQGFNETGWNRFRWSYSTSLTEMAEFLNKYLTNRNHPMAGIQKIDRVEVTERAPSGRVLTMEVQTDKGPLEISKDQIRNAFYPPISTLFYLDPMMDENQMLKGYTFVGGGFGHGVGLSQTGAYRLAELGWNGEQIVQFYFPGTQIQPLNEAIVFWRDPMVED
ncbi:SpoIID/LytB domain-containing protein [Roseofilum sp. BLCC_M154]|uniref:SpoIID/LytB domain-containing protein n=1 Tax=Roseofilum acuticapitatum BLCC-M154 TaxID=3022444 RepID=A0ABT7ANX8_9CYAN|nr:SpoIID/LytB domain-containing protein [Roseofilum acuticapitatum]MDJ1168601.1 SpoIID/LytB domain-containing protein [Roseofilum acuticapitatum BLCC-M154]